MSAVANITGDEPRVSAEEVRRWRAEQRQRYGDDDSGRLRPRRRLRAAPPLGKVAEALRVCGLRPVLDEQLQRVLVDCPDCRAQDADELGLYRPVQVIARDGTVVALCMACGVREVLHV